MTYRHLPKPYWWLMIGLIALGVMSASGCKPADQPTPFIPISSPSPEPAPTETMTVVPSPSPTPTVAISATPTPIPLERPKYHLQAHLDYANHRLDVQQKVLVPHPADLNLGQIDLVVPANSWWGAFSIQEISTGEIPLASYQLEGVTLRLIFGDAGWQPDQILTLEIDYTLTLPPQNNRPGYGPSPFGYTSRQTNLVDWYVMVPPYLEESGWLIHDPWFFGEYLVYPAADFEVSLDPGRPGLVVAASSLPVGTGSVPSVGDSDPLQYSLEGARNFVFSISPEYDMWVTDLGDVKILGYFFPGYQVPAQAAFDATVQSLVIYQDLFGPYQQPSLTMVQGDFDHGMEYEGLYFLSNAFYNVYNGTEKSYLIAIAVHETAHQWWFGQVANDQALEPWLDEALCTFSELAFYEHYYPESVDWWWYTRVNYYQPSGRIDRSIYGYQEFVEKYLNYRNATYLQGAKFMAALKDQLGEDAFYAFLQEYASRYQDGIASRQDFFEVLGEFQDLSEMDWLAEYFPVN